MRMAHSLNEHVTMFSLMKKYFVLLQTDASQQNIL